MLGSYKDCYEGKDLFNFVVSKLQLPPDNATKFLNDLCSMNYIRPISGRSPVFSTSSQYQWKQLAFEVANEAPYKKALREAEKAEFDHLRAMRSIESVRQSLESACADYMFIMQTVVYEHIRIIKDSLIACVELEKLPIKIIQDVHKNLALFLESLDPDKETQVFVEQYRTGVRPLQPYVFSDSRNYTSEVVNPQNRLVFNTDNNKAYIFIIDIWN